MGLANKLGAAILAGMTLTSLSSIGFADEVTQTTTTTRSTSDQGLVPAVGRAVGATVGAVVGAPPPPTDCTKTKTTTTNEDTGDSVTRTTTACN